MMGYNYFMLIGEVVQVTRSDLFELTRVELNVTREFKNSEGMFEADRFVIIFKNFLKEVVDEHIKVGDTITVKGRLLPDKDIGLVIVPERVLFMDSKGE